MAKSSNATRASGAKARAAKAAAGKAHKAKRAPARKAAPARSVRAQANKPGRGNPAAIKRSAARPQLVKARNAPPQAPTPVEKVVAKAVVEPLSAAAIAAALLPLRSDERSAVQQALGGTPTLLAASARARDAAIFAAAALASSQPVLVASPLAAELFARVTELGSVDVVALGAFLDPTSHVTSYKRWQRGGSLLIVVDPAMLFSAEVRQASTKAPLALVGVAAAHACSEHAHELSPAYLSLREALRAFAAPVLATCTRTSARVLDQVTQAIGAASGRVITASAVTLLESAQVVRPTERKAALLSAIMAYGAPGIVLTATSQEADAVFAELNARGVGCVRAHAGVASAERAAALQRFAEPSERLVLVAQSPHANASGLAGCPESSRGLESAPPRADLSFVVHYQAPLSPEQHFEDSAWLPEGAASLVLADSSDAALVQAILAQQRIKPATIEAMAQALAQAPTDRPASSDTLALRAGTSRRGAERVLFAFAERSLIVRDNGQISRKASDEALAAEGRLLATRFAALRAADTARAEGVVRYVTSHHGGAPSVGAAAGPAAARGVRA